MFEMLLSTICSHEMLPLCCTIYNNLPSIVTCSSFIFNLRYTCMFSFALIYFYFSNFIVCFQIVICSRITYFAPVYYFVLISSFVLDSYFAPIYIWSFIPIPSLAPIFIFAFEILGLRKKYWTRLRLFQYF